jgi:CDP-diacylglycerol--serine O-phosphatidyltransferase
MTCALIRLARYNVINYSKGFIGIPITFNGLFIPLFYLLDINPEFLPFFFLISGFLMISTIHIRRFI